jgi:O-antigen/teichoic acid export membrane protein
MKKEKNVYVNAILNAIKQICMIVFPMITFPYASRILGAENYGKINFSSSLVSYFTLIAALGINNYAIREGAKLKEDSKRFDPFINQIFTLNMISTLFSYLLLFLLIFSSNTLHSYTLLLLIQASAILFTTLGADWINVIYEDYLFITIRYIICQTLALVLMFTLVHTKTDYIAYAFCSVSATWLANLMNFYYIHKKLGIHFRFCSPKTILVHLKPVLILFGSSIASMIYINSDISIIGFILGDEEVGYYSVSVKIYSLIKQVFNAMIMVFLPRISAMADGEHNDEISATVNNLANLMIFFLLPAVTGLVMMAGPIIELFAGNGYSLATQPLQILGLAIPFACFACLYINVLLLPFHKDKIILKATIFSAAVNLILNFLLIPYFGINAAAFTTLLSEIIMLVFGVYAMKGLLQLYLKKAFLSGMLAGFLAFLLCKASYLLFTNTFVILFSAVIMCVLMVALLGLFFWKEQIMKIVSRRRASV